MIGFEEGMELNEIVEDSNEKIQCFLCEERFNTTFDMDEHLVIVHQLNRANLSIYFKRSINNKGINQGKMRRSKT